jgi:uncharacterized protein (TIGR02996 family)
VSRWTVELMSRLGRAEDLRARGLADIPPDMGPLTIGLRDLFRLLGGLALEVAEDGDEVWSWHPAEHCLDGGAIGLALVRGNKIVGDWTPQDLVNRSAAGERVDEQSAFLRAIAEAPEDDAPRLVYADWLDERGEATRAEYLRVEHRGRAAPAAERERLAALSARLDPDWLRAVHHGHLWPDWCLILQARLSDRREAAAAVQAGLGLPEAEAVDLVGRLPSELCRGLSFWAADRLRQACGDGLIVTVEYRPDVVRK